MEATISFPERFYWPIGPGGRNLRLWLLMSTDLSGILLCGSLALRLCVANEWYINSIRDVEPEIKTRPPFRTSAAVAYVHVYI